jgi:hypothetical protein
MRFAMHQAAALTVVWFALASSRATADEPTRPAQDGHYHGRVDANDANVELQSGPLTPGLVLDESRRPVHQVRLLVEAEGRSGTLVLDPNIPEFDEFGGLVGGIQTPQVGRKGGALPAVELRCVVEPVKTGPDRWLLFRLRGPKITSSLCLATRGHVGEGGPARLLVLGADKRVKTVVELTQYGLVVP